MTKYFLVSSTQAEADADAEAYTHMDVHTVSRQSAFRCLSRYLESFCQAQSSKQGTHQGLPAEIAQLAWLVWLGAGSLLGMLAYYTPR